MKHSDLVAKGKRWLVNNGYNPVYAEQGYLDCLEFPDVIGWHNGSSTLIEVKVTIDDFKQDAQKIIRRKPELGMGSYRYFLIPKELVEQILPLLPEGWGLKSFHASNSDVFNGRIFNVKNSAYFEKNKIAEIRYLCSRIKEIQRFGV